jgi:cyanophycin synthetase
MSIAMKIIETKVMRGPNQWSVDEEFLIVQKVQMIDLEGLPVEPIFEKAGGRFPGLVITPDPRIPASDHLLSLIRFIAMELQNMAGMPCKCSEIRNGKRPNEYYLLFSYQVERAGIYAGEAAVKITEALLTGADYNLDEHLEELQRLKRKYSMGPTSTYLLDEIKRRKIPYRQFKNGSLIALGHGVNQKKIRTAVTDHTSALGLEIAGDKEETKSILLEAGIPVPGGILVRSEEELRERLHEVDFPLVIKPLNGNHGRGVTTEIYNLEKALFGFSIASRISRTVIVEEYIRGEDYRFLVIGFRLVAVAKRMPAYIIGDGHSTIHELIKERNADPQRGDTSDHVLAKIVVDDVTNKILSSKKLNLSSVLKAGEKLVLKDTANISAGGTALDVTEQVHPENKFMAERIARIFNLDICGVDIMTTSVEIPITRGIGAVIEVNAGPGLRMHSNPQNGARRDVAGPIFDMLFPEACNARIPIVAVTGTNGKTTTTRLVAHIAKQAGKKPGYCTSDGVYLDGHLAYEGDCTGYVSARQVLFDPTIDFAVLECARGGIIRSGLGFDQCDVSIITNVSSDHLGLHDIETVEDMARIKGVVARTTKKDGYAILNADDDKVYALAEHLECRIAMFSLDPASERIKKHVDKNGIAAVVENGNITVISGDKMAIASCGDIPLTFNGQADFMVRNILASVLASVVCGFSIDTVKKALTSFIPSPALTPGRMNLFEFDNFKVMVDYVHNTDGFSEVKKFLDKLPDHPKTAVISIAGDRRDVDIRYAGSIAGSSFSTIIIRNDRDHRGRDADEVAALLKEGIATANRNAEVLRIEDEKEAIEYAISHAQKGSFIFICADKVKETLRIVKELQNAPELQKQ